MAATGAKLLAYDERTGLLPLQSYFDDDFFFYATGATAKWTSLTTGTAAAVAVTAGSQNGIINILSGTGAAGNDSGVISTLAGWKFATGGCIVGESLLQYSEASTNKANIFFGFSSVAAAGLMTDGAMSVASQTTVGIFKIDGGTNWNCFVSNGTTVQSVLSAQTAGGTNYQRLRVEIVNFDGVNMQCSFFCNTTGGAAVSQLVDNTNHRPIVLNVAQASAAAMKFVAGYAASGSTAAAESLNVDYAYATQHRMVAGGF